MGRVYGEDYPGTSLDITSTLNNFGRELKRTSRGQTLTSEYSPIGDKRSESGPLGTVAYGYDLSRGLLSITWPDAFEIVMDHDQLGRVVEVREAGVTTGPGVLAQYTYDDLGRVTDITRGNGTSSAYAYDSSSRLTSLSHDLTGSTGDVVFSGSFNAAGQKETNTISNDLYFWEDHLNSDVTTSYNGLNEISLVGAAAATYDSRGNVTSIVGRSYGYDLRNRLSSAGSVQLSYDASDRLFRVGAAGPRFLYSGDELIAELDSSGQVTSRYVPSGVGTGPAVEYTGPSMSRHWLLEDRLGSIIGLVGETGALATALSYDEYGRQPASNAGRFRYTGQIWIPESSTYHYKARDYDPVIGRFLQSDPAGYAAGLNLYAYVGGDPVNNDDPTGEQTTTLSDVFSTCGQGCQQSRAFFQSSIQSLRDQREAVLQSVHEGASRFADFMTPSDPAGCVADTAAGGAVGAGAGAVVGGIAGGTGGFVVGGGVASVATTPAGALAGAEAGAQGGFGLGVIVAHATSPSCHNGGGGGGGGNPGAPNRPMGRIREADIRVGNVVDVRRLTSGQRVSNGRSVTNQASTGAAFRDADGWMIQAERAGDRGHASAWKLFNPQGRRVATLSADGRILRMP